MLIDFKELKTILPFIGSVFIFCGYLKFSVFYSHFGIEIYNYLEFGEILTLFMPEIITFSTIFLFWLFLIYMVIESDDLQRNTILYDKISEAPTFWKRLKIYFKLYELLVFYSVCSLIFFIAISIWYPEKIEGFDLIVITTLLILLYSVLEFESKRKFKLLNGKIVNQSYSNLIFITFLFLLFSIISAYNEIKEVKNTIKIYTFSYNKKTVVTDSHNVYLGQTKNYLFVKNLDDGEVSIYERDLISNLKVRNYRK